MSATRPPTREAQDRMMADEQAKLRKIGLSTIGVIVVLIVVGFIALGGSQEDSPDVLIVFAGSASIDTDEDEFIRVEGQIRRAVEDDRYNDESTVALFADDVKKSQASDSSQGLADINDLRGAREKVGDRVTVVGKVESVSANNRVIAISQPSD